MAKRVAILQSNYLPWKGYFDLIKSVDEFVLYDDVQFTRRDWRNRNQIKTPNGLQWITIPVQSKGKYDQRICDVFIQGTDWGAKHWRSIQANYARAPHFDWMREHLQELIENPVERLSQHNENLLRKVCAMLSIETPITRSADYGGTGIKTERLVTICKAASATCYVSGPAAKVYLEEAVFEEEGMAVEWFDYGPYPAYDQFWGDFTDYVSIIDLLAHKGYTAGEFVNGSAKS